VAGIKWTNDPADGIYLLLDPEQKLVQAETLQGGEEIDSDSINPLVLVIDDNEHICSLLHDLLARRGIVTESAYSGQQGLEKARQCKYDLFLLDMTLPDLSGLEVCKILKSSPELKEIPVIIITGRDTTEDKVRGFEAGAVDFISKPFVLAEVEARILSAIRAKRTHDSEMWVNRQEKERTQEELFRISKAMDSASDAVCIVDPAGHPIYVNLAFTELFERTFEQFAPAQSQESIFTDPKTWPAILETCLAGKSWKGEVEMLAGPDQKITALCRGNAILDERQTLAGAVFIFTDITHRKRLEQDLLYLANHDPLTSLYNRRYFCELLNEALEHSRRGTSSYLLYIDLDNFKVVNDSAGHQAGDRCLKEIARLLRKSLREKDKIGRFGGDEFTVLLQNITEEEAFQIAKRLVQTLDNFRFVDHGRTYSTSASIGMASLDTNLTAEDIFARADATCYLVKSKGRNDYELYHADSSQIQALDTQANWSLRIKDALRDNRIKIWLQPILPLKGQMTPYFEVLIRMVDLEGQIIFPGEFLPAAEHFGNMLQLDQCVIKQAFELLGEHPHLRLSINLSAKTITDPGLPKFIGGLLSTHRAPARNVSFEITETAMIQNLDTARKLITEIKEFGCHFALDDFGSGASSMMYLRDLPIDYLKIDGSFIRNIATDPINRALVKSMNEVAHIVGKQTVAEYVTDANVLKVVQELGIDYAQGWYVCEPAPPAKFLTSDLAFNMASV
jgi:diguanylate cyclase (GGDEF)-like protein